MSWWLYTAAVSSLLSLGALGCERALRWRWRAGRWAWLGALAASTLLLASAWADLSPEWSMPGRTGAIAGPLVRGAAQLEIATADLPWGALWLGSTALMLAAIAFEVLTTARRLRRWSSARVSGYAVRVSADEGPAAIGILRPEVVLPGWVFALPASAQRLVVLHEGEHRRAGDNLLQLVGALLVAAVPWNPVAWYQMSRLRRALELDCDARVLARTGDLRAYAEVLISVGERASGRRALLSTRLSWARPFLERRIKTLLSAGQAPRLLRASMVPTLLLALAVAAPSPARLVVARGLSDTVGQSVIEIRERDSTGAATLGVVRASGIPGTRPSRPRAPTVAPDSARAILVAPARGGVLTRAPGRR